jgi:LacI family transcriptional regulator, repressor for deo operon, udp, cdd, tsx, nupC, and nupG
MEAKTITIRDVALAAGVSIGTVSRALKAQPGLSDATRENVMRVARDLNYDTSKLRTGKPRRLLFIHGRHHASLAQNPFYSVVLQGVEEVCRDENVSLSLLSVSQGDPVRAWVRRHDPEALLVAGYLEPELLAELRPLDLPLALVDHASADIYCVNDDNLKGAFEATQHLMTQGCQRIAFIGGPMAHHSVGLRARGYRKALFEVGRLADPDLEVWLDPGLPYPDAARAAMRQLLALPQRPDGVFAYNDATALCAMDVCLKAGVSIPHEIAFIGYDDIAAAAVSDPPLSTVRVDKLELGQRAAMQLISGELHQPETLLPVELVLRASSVRTAPSEPVAAPRPRR